MTSASQNPYNIIEHIIQAGSLQIGDGGVLSMGFLDSWINKVARSIDPLCRKYTGQWACPHGFRALAPNGLFLFKFTTTKPGVSSTTRLTHCRYAIPQKGADLLAMSCTGPRSDPLVCTQRISHLGECSTVRGKEVPPIDKSRTWGPKKTQKTKTVVAWEASHLKSIAAFGIPLA